MFSFGIVMWELLTGEEPYADLHYGAIIGNVWILRCDELPPFFTTLPFSFILGGGASVI